jgi:hypothetical protein
LIYQEVLFIGESRRFEKKALETGISLHRGPHWGTWRRVHLLGTSTVKECLINAASLSMGGL